MTHHNSPLTDDLLLHKTKQPKKHWCLQHFKMSCGEESAQESFRLAEEEYWQTKCCVGTKK